VKPLSRAALEALAGPIPAAPTEWIRVQLDTGGIAAGAEEVLTELTRSCHESRPETVVLRTGSIGYSFADPVVEVQAPGMPRTHYGQVTPAMATAIVQQHCGEKRLLEDQVIATRQRGLSLEKPTTHVLVRDTDSEAAGKTEFFQFSLKEELKTHGMADRVQVVRALDLGVYNAGLVVQLLPSAVTYTNVQPGDIPRLVVESIGRNQILTDLLWKKPDRQVRIVLRNCGAIDPESIDDYLRQVGGYQALRRALFELTPEQVIQEMKVSGLRGRGGAGYPTWMKWRLTREQPAAQRYVICNGD
jgi:NADP-reducing hydrogenase subunit HndC